MTETIDLKAVLDPANYADGTVFDLAGPLAGGAIALDEIVPARAPWSAVVKRGQVLTIVDVGGNQSGDCLLYNARDTAERYSVPDTVVGGGNLYVRAGTVLRSCLGNPLATVVANEIDRQDTIGGACGKESNSLRYGHHTTAQHGCRENFLAEAAKYGIGRPRHRVEPQLVHERAGGSGRRARHRRRHLRPRQAGRHPGRDGHPRPGLQLPAAQQPVQRLQPHPAADDRHGAGVTGWAFDTVLVANRGEIARRVIRTARALGLRTVAVYSAADISAPHVREADEAVAIGPARPQESYLSIPAILAAAKSSGAGAVHPGYGFLSEDAGFARQAADAGLVFVGPTPEQLAAFGAKHTARELARAAGVPLMAGTGLLATAAEAVAAARDIGLPVMVKATGGGGGIGLQACFSESAVAEAFDRVSRIAAAHFGSRNGCAVPAGRPRRLPRAAGPPGPARRGAGIRRRGRPGHRAGRP